MDKKILAKYLDFANHNQGATEADIKILCQKVIEYGFHTAFVNPYYISLAKGLLGGQGAVGTVVSFPLGQESREIKMASAIWAVKSGADELDVSMNVGLFKDKKYDEGLNEMKMIVSNVKELGKNSIVKFIIETGCLTDEEIKKASELVLLSGADFVKTCSGMGPRGASLKDVELIKSVVGEKIKVKVAGGVVNLDQAMGFIQAGVSRIGTSHAIDIVEGIKNSKQENSE